MNSFGIEKGTTIRYPSTANLMIDSFDRSDKSISPFNFIIYKPQSIQNGFFSRIGVTEVVLEWGVPNINNDISNNFINVDISGATGTALLENVFIPEGFYTVKQALDTLAEKLTDLSGTTGSTFSVVPVEGGGYGIEISAGEWKINGGLLADQLGMLQDFYAPLLNPLYGAADLRPYRYLDFVSDELTYNQDLKDNATSNVNRDTLCRWYFATDNVTAYDAYGYPILLGYQQFVLRRLFNPPKQIKWDPAQPIGTLSFRVYDELGNLLPATSNYNTSNWLMTLQLSEN